MNTAIPRLRPSGLLAVLAAVLLALVLPTAPSQASPGDLDPAFSGDGVLTTPVAPGANGDAISASGVAVQPDGKIVTAGRADMGATGQDFALARYNADGSLDLSFSGDGIQTTPVSPLAAGGDSAAEGCDLVASELG